MYMDQLEPTRIGVDSIFLDPNNPRFWDKANQSIIPDSAIHEATKQLRARIEIDKHSIGDLYNSILRNGYLLLDRIVVRPLNGSVGKYVVVEGNRRFRALSKLRADISAGDVVAEEVDDDYLAKLYEQTNEIEVLVYKGSDKADISWMFQGIRHLSGIKDWNPAQRAKLLADQIDVHNKRFSVAGEQFGLSRVAAGRLYRSYHALQQMREDEEYGPKARNDYFSLFDEAYKNFVLRDWLDWDETEKRFTNISRLKRFYSWISPDDEHGDVRRIHNPGQIRDIAYLIENDHKELLSLFESHDLSIADARARATNEGPKSQDWRKSLDRAHAILNNLPQSVLTDDPAGFIAELDKLLEVIAQRRKMAEVALDNE